MPRGITRLLSTVSSPGEDLAAAGDDGADRDLSAQCGGFGLGHGFCHATPVVVVEDPIREHRTRITKGLRIPEPFEFEFEMLYFTSIRSPTARGAHARVMSAVE
jgi:hypothetical protein